MTSNMHLRGRDFFYGCQKHCDNVNGVTRITGIEVPSVVLAVRDVIHKLGRELIGGVRYIIDQVDW